MCSFLEGFFIKLYGIKIVNYFERGKTIFACIEFNGRKFSAAFSAFKRFDVAFLFEQSSLQ